MAAAVDVAARRLPWQATVAPAWARAMAMAAPRPEAEPVTGDLAVETELVEDSLHGRTTVTQWSGAAELR